MAEKKDGNNDLWKFWMGLASDLAGKNSEMREIVLSLHYENEQLRKENEALKAKGEK